jgi:cell division protein FtsL
MELPGFFTLKRVFIITTALTLISFFVLLVIANMMNRRGIKELQVIEQETVEYSTNIRALDRDIATYSSLIRIETRARDLGFTPIKKTEFIK